MLFFDRKLISGLYYLGSGCIEFSETFKRSHIRSYIHSLQTPYIVIKKSASVIFSSYYLAFVYGLVCPIHCMYIPRGHLIQIPDFVFIRCKSFSAQTKSSGFHVSSAKLVSRLAVIAYIKLLRRLTESGKEL